MEMVNEILNNTKKKMEARLEHFKKELAKLRTGRASVSLLEDVIVEYYGTPTPLNQVATIQIPDPSLILVQPWDLSQIGAIEKSILKANIGLNPINDGRVLKIPIPPLDEERRKELAKIVKRMLEDEKAVIRTVRRDSKEHIEALEKDKKISEDDKFKSLDKLQEITDTYIKKAEELTIAKEKEILGR
ncbi:MAG: ribosome recycling factor [Candidatus Aminicenantia bacterium]